MLESKIERKFTVWCEANGIVARKYTTPGRNGSPDHIFFYKGRTALIEFKQPTKTPDPLQVIELGILEEAGIDVTWVDNVADAKEWLCDVFDIEI